MSVKDGYYQESIKTLALVQVTLVLKEFVLNLFKYFLLYKMQN